MGQASSLSIRDDRQDAGPTNNLSFGDAVDCFVPRDAGLAMTAFSQGVTEDLPFEATVGRALHRGSPERTVIIYSERGTRRCQAKKLDQCDPSVTRGNR